MSREIKFRFFDTTSRNMYGMKDIQEYDLEQLHRFSSTDDPYTKVMQYTGIKDKNGVEVYEGDVLKVTRSNPVWDEDIIDYSVVEYEKCRFMVNLGTKKLNVSNDYWGTTMEAIGNIHENPELLNG